MRNSKGQFIKGSPAQNKIWDDDKVYNELIEAVSTIHNKIGFVPVFTFFGKHKKYKTLFSAIKRTTKKPLLLYKKVLDGKYGRSSSEA